jgi:dipeptidyl aminopeptidase/acylaminoacyl peptidase
MKYSARTVSVIAAAICLVTPLFAAFAAQQRPLVARDCVEVNHFREGDIYTSIQIEPKGSRVAYVVKSPDIDTNTNDVELYVKDLQDTSPDAGRQLIRANDIANVRWTNDAKSLVMLVKKKGGNSIVEVNPATAEQRVLVHDVGNIIEYSIDRDARTIVYVVADNEYGSSNGEARPEVEMERGYRIPFESPGTSTGLPTRALYVTRQTSQEAYSAPERVSFKEPFTGEVISNIPYASWTSLSPDGTRLLFDYVVDRSSIPEEWKQNNPLIQMMDRQASPMVITILYDFATQRGTVPLKRTFNGSLPLWSSDGKSFMITGPAPAGSKWLERDVRLHRTMGEDANLYWVTPGKDEIEEVLPHVLQHREVPLAWTADGDLILHVKGDEIARYRRSTDGWHEVARVRIPLKDFYPYSLMTSNGETVVGVYQATTTPPDLFALDIKSSQMRMFTKINPQLEGVTLAPSRNIEWNTPDGMKIEGVLFLPPGYDPNKRYPLVIQTKAAYGFMCDSGGNHDPAFAPQPIANAGMMYLARRFPEDWEQAEDVMHYPKNVPGGLGEVAQQMNIWEAAINTLDKRGLIDPSKVGIIGFSRTGWYVEYILAHSNLHFAAASAADNVEYNLTEYTISHTGDELRDRDAMYGGPPYGDTLKNWLTYSVSFNVDKIHTPLLMEEMGYGIRDNTIGLVPENLATHYEVFTGLNRLHRPVELYYYPDERHQPDDPVSRLFSLQRNVDWFRFWLRGEEDPDPAKTDQYARWRVMRKLQEHQNDSPKN